MKANEFVKKFGWDRAKREVALIGTIAMMCGDNDFNNDLKRLVDSHDLVEECGGLDKAKERVALEEKLPNPNVFYILVVSSAIDDVESCQ